MKKVFLCVVLLATLVAIYGCQITGPAPSNPASCTGGREGYFRCDPDGSRVLKCLNIGTSESPSFSWMVDRKCEDPAAPICGLDASSPAMPNDPGCIAGCLFNYDNRGDRSYMTGQKVCFEYNPEVSLYCNMSNEIIVTNCSLTQQNCYNGECTGSINPVSSNCSFDGENKLNNTLWCDHEISAMCIEGVVSGYNCTDFNMLCDSSDGKCKCKDYTGFHALTNMSLWCNADLLSNCTEQGIISTNCSMISNTTICQNNQCVEGIKPYDCKDWRNGYFGDTECNDYNPGLFVCAANRFGVGFWNQTPCPSNKNCTGGNSKAYCN
jgi:hypothetical protein